VVADEGRELGSKTSQGRIKMAKKALPAGPDEGRGNSHWEDLSGVKEGPWYRDELIP
jgi:hypothetical protein